MRLDNFFTTICLFQIPPPLKDTPTVLKPRYKARRAPSNRPMGRQTARSGKQIVVVGSEEYNQVVDPSIEDGPFSFRSRNRKKGLSEKGHAASEEKGSLPGQPLSREEAHCPHTTPELGPLSTKVCDCV